MPFCIRYLILQTVEIMKSEHRHELAENDLEVFINKMRARFAEVMELHGNRILLWASAVLLLIAAFVFYRNNSGSANAEGWAALYGSRNAEDLASVADSYKETPVGQWAKLRMGEQYMQSGLTLMFTDREAGKADLEEARNAFNELLNDSETSDEIRERALYGLATVLESLSGSDLKPAIETYRKLLSSFPNTPYQVVVKERIEELENRSTQEFYAWFAEQKPEPKDLELPKDLQGQSSGLNLPPGLPNNPSGDQPSKQEMPAKQAEGKASKDAAKPGPKLSIPTAPTLPPSGKKGKAGEKKPEPGKKGEANKTKTEKSAATKPAEPSAAKEQGKPAPVKKEQGKPAAPKTETPKEKTVKPNSESK